MVSKRRDSDDADRATEPPARSPEAREMQLVSLAFDLAEKQLKDGTASSQLITTIMKAGTERDRLERARIQADVSLMNIRAESYESQKRTEELYVEAMAAFARYSGNTRMMPSLNEHPVVDEEGEPV